MDGQAHRTLDVRIAEWICQATQAPLPQSAATSGVEHGESCIACCVDSEQQAIGPGADGEPTPPCLEHGIDASSSQRQSMADH
jgi:hypothetical protein